jgi:hypothetical protein
MNHQRVTALLLKLRLKHAITINHRRSLLNPIIAIESGCHVMHEAFQ